MIVGEAPGRSEIEQGVPFVGRSGRLLDEALAFAGTSRAEVYITNIFKGDVGEGNRNPTRAEINDHWPLLEAEIAKVRPAGILTLGSLAGSAFILDFKVTRDHGEKYAWADGIFVFPALHPSYVLRQHDIDVEEEFKFDVSKAWLISQVLYENRRDNA